MYLGSVNIPTSVKYVRNSGVKEPSYYSNSSNNNNNNGSSSHISNCSKSNCCRVEFTKYYESYVGLFSIYSYYV